jgi:hypothetical protein
MKLHKAGKISGAEAANRIKKFNRSPRHLKKNMGGVVMKNRGGTFKGTF